MLSQGPQALHPAAAHSRGSPGCSPTGSCLPKELRQQFLLLKILEAVLLGGKYPCEAEQEGEDSGTQVLGFQHVEQQLYQAGILL